MSGLSKAVILAAGKGTRMGELTAQVPKPMLLLVGKPILEHVLNRLSEAGIRETLLVVGYYGEKIREHFAGYKMALRFEEQTVINGTAKAAMLARDFVGDDAFLMTFGDILCEPADYRGLIALMDSEACGVLGVKYVEDPAPGAAVYEEEGRVVKIIEKPPVGTSSTNWNSAGVYVFRAKIFAELERVAVSSRGEYELTSGIAQLIEHGETLRMYPIASEWLDVGRPADLKRAEEMLRKLSSTEEPDDSERSRT